MKRSCNMISVITVLVVIPFLSTEAVSSKAPVLTQLEVDEYNNEIKPLDSADKKKSELIIQDIKYLRLECRSSYPVQWIYTGSGIPIINTDISHTPLSTSDEKGTDGEYVASVFLGPLKEQHTGNYHCSRTNNVVLTSSLYIYVPGEDLFLKKEGKTISTSPAENWIWIPCSVTDPNLRVELFKLTGRESAPPAAKTDKAIVYNPRRGFHINLKEIESPEGRYYCRAERSKDVYKDVSYTIKFTSPETDVYDNPAPAKLLEAARTVIEKQSDDLKDKDLFVTKKGKVIEVTPAKASIFIPCAVSDPRIKVEIYRVEENTLVAPVKERSDSITYDPVKGFRVYLREVKKPQGEYHCRAFYGDRYEDVYYTVVYKFDD